MMNKHVKSPCCNAPVRRFGKRRRQCTQCSSTWRIRQKRRGRKRTRITASLLTDTIEHRETLVQRARRSPLSAAVLQKRHRYQLASYLARDSVVSIPSGKLILILDGVWFQFQDARWVIYLLAVRHVRSTVATFLDPVFLPGRESLSSWQHVLNQTPQKVKKRIVAMVADGFRGGDAIAAENGWVFQRCHFHLIAELQRMRGVGKRVEHPKIREAIYQTVREALETTDQARLTELMRTLHRLALHLHCPHWMGMRVREFLRHIGDFRAYQNHPEFRLPSTTNTVESMGRTIRDIVRRSHGFRTPQSLRQWITAQLRMCPTRKCNPKKFPKIQPIKIR